MLEVLTVNLLLLNETFVRKAVLIAGKGVFLTTHRGLGRLNQYFSRDCRNPESCNLDSGQLVCLHLCEFVLFAGAVVFGNARDKNVSPAVRV